MTNTSEQPSWQTPLKDLHAARFIFNEARANIIAKQKKEYDEQVLGYMASLQETGLPFVEDFSGEPDQIKHVKNFINALYLAEKAFEKLGNLNLATRSTYNAELITEGYKACHLLLQIASETEAAFQHEVEYVGACLSTLLTLINTTHSKGYVNLSSISSTLGHTIGRTLEQMKLVTEKGDSDLFAYFGAVFPEFPAYIENVKTAVKKQTLKNPAHTLHVNKEKMEQLLQNGRQLSKTIANSKKNIFLFIFNSLSLIKQIHALFIDMSQEAGELNDTLLALACENLAMLKYELLPLLFAGVDKLEAQLMLQPGRLSATLMEQVKPWYEALTQTAKLLPGFEKKGEKLLKLEDARFIELRLAPLHQKIETSMHALHQITPALEALEAYRLALIGMNAGIDCSQNMRETRETLKQHVEYLKPYIAHLDKNFLHVLDMHLTTEPSWFYYFYDSVNAFINLTNTNYPTKNNPSIDNIMFTIDCLKNHLKQIKVNHEFMSSRNNNLIQSIRDKSSMALFPYNEHDNILEFSENDAFAHRHSLSNLRYSTAAQGKVYISNPEALTGDEAWDLYRWYDNKVTNVISAEEQCHLLLTSLTSRQRECKTKSLSFLPNYTTALLKNDTFTLHQPQHIYVKIVGAALKYEVLEPSTSGCKLYLMPIADAVESRYRNCYVWNASKKQLSFIMSDGRIQNDIPLADPLLLTLFIPLTKKIKRMRQERKEEPTIRYLTTDNITKLITDNGGHHPGLIRTGSIPLSEINCSLTKLSSTAELTPYLPRLFAEALERGHIKDDFRRQCIKAYSVIQPYLISAFKENKNMDIQAFDKNVAHIFSGCFYRQTPNSEPELSYAYVNSVLPALKRVLSSQRIILENRRNDCVERIENKAFLQEAALNKEIKHHTFSPYVAEFMASIDPITRLIHDAKKTLFKVNLALQHLDNYCNTQDVHKFGYNTLHEDYPWFQMYLASRPESSAEQLRVHLLQIQGYETAQIKHHERIIDWVKKNHTVELISSHQLMKPSELLSETSAFMHFGHDYQPCAFGEDRVIEPNQLQIKIQGDELHYRILHYGKLLEGELPLNKIEPALTDFDETTLVNKDTVSSILYHIYNHRSDQIQSDKTVLTSDEALDLYLWFRTKQLEFKELNGISDVNHQAYLTKKIAAYKRQAEKKPTFKTEHNAMVSQVSHENRSEYLIKHRQISTYLAELKYSVYRLFENLNEPLKNELRLSPRLSSVPYPEVGSQNWLTDIMKALFNRDPIDLLKAMPLFNQPASPDTITKLQTPRQVLIFKRLMNIIYYLEQIMHELEKVNAHEGQIPYVVHLVVSWFYVQDILTLTKEISNDPHLSAIYEGISLKACAICRGLMDANNFYVDEKTSLDVPDENPTLQRLLNGLEILPYHISLTPDEFRLKHPSLKKNAADMRAKIEGILKNYNSSWSYLRVFCDLFLIETLVEKTRDNIAAILTNTHKKTRDNLKEINTTLLAEILLEADKWERTLGLKTGILSNPVKDIIDEFYKGLVVSLVADIDERVDLLCDTDIIQKRIQTARLQEQTANADILMHTASSTSMQQVLDACSGNPINLSQLNDAYKAALPQLKKALNGSDLYLMSYHSAKAAGHKDCFVWHKENSQLFYIDSAGNPNEQAGCTLSLISLPDGELPDSLEHEVTLLQPFWGQQNAEPIKVKKPTLVRQGDCFYIYANADNTGWKFTPLNASVISKMNVDFSLKHLNVHKKYNDLYTEISKQTGLVYPIHLKNTYKTIEFITKKTRIPIDCIYLNENEVNAFITSNSHFVLQKRGVSINAGSCLLTMPSAPSNFYDLKLPADYHSYYVQVDGDMNSLYLIKRTDSSIMALPILEEKKPEFISTMSRIKKNQLLLEDDFVKISSLTGCLCENSFMSNADEFSPQKGNITPLKSLVAHAKAYYGGLIATSAVEQKTAGEQLDFLVQVQQNLGPSNLIKKQLILTKYCNEQIDKVCQDTMGLQGYELRNLTNKTREVKPNCLYVRIINETELEYKVINQAGRVRGTKIALQDIQCPLNKPLTSANDLLPYLPAILQIASTKGDGHTLPYSLASDYQKALQRHLLDNMPTFVERAMELGSASIDSNILAQKTAFNEQNISKYRQLDTINKAVNEFQLYLKGAEKHWTTRQSLFESKETIQKKNRILHEINESAAKSDMPVEARIQTIRNYLQAPTMLDSLIDFQDYNPTLFARLIHCIFQLAEAVGLYKPRVAQHLNKLLSAMDLPPHASQAKRTWLHFFSTSQEKESTPPAPFVPPIP